MAFTNRNRNICKCHKTSLIENQRAKALFVKRYKVALLLMTYLPTDSVILGSADLFMTFFPVYHLKGEHSDSTDVNGNYPIG